MTDEILLPAEAGQIGCLCLLRSQEDGARTDDDAAYEAAVIRLKLEGAALAWA